ncbi:MAG: hypothetical protein OEX19_11250, partial [Gammaproteobacteria bacterium]|nr:hypothetical protein [Gammaproteobacteria bacterium]
MDRNNSETRPNEKSSLSNDELRLSAFESIFSSPDRGVILLNSCGKIVDSNTIARAIFNINEDTDDLSNIESSFTFSDDEFTKKISMALQNKTDLTLEGFCEQQIRWFRISISTFTNGSMLFVKDITKQR